MATILISKILELPTNYNNEKFYLPFGTIDVDTDTSRYQYMPDGRHDIISLVSLKASILTDYSSIDHFFNHVIAIFNTQGLPLYLADNNNATTAIRSYRNVWISSENISGNRGGSICDWSGTVAQPYTSACLPILLKNNSGDYFFAHTPIISRYIDNIEITSFQSPSFDTMGLYNYNIVVGTRNSSWSSASYLNDGVRFYINTWAQNLTPAGGGADPYGDGGTSEPGGGGGSFDDSTDVITIPEYDPVDLLNRSYGNRGFVHVYLPTQAELTQLHAFMWNNSLIAEMQKMFNNVADAVISLNLLPLDFTDATPNRGNILMGLVDSQIETTIAKQQFVTLDCGTIEINEFFASYLDYSPYSKLQIYLPYIGVKDLDIDEFMNAYISVKYVIDIVSGACVAFISKTGAIDNDVVKDNPILGVLYQFAGNCALNVPISGANYAQVHAADIGALIGGAGVLGTFLTGGMSAPAAVTGILSTAANVVTSKPAISRGGSIPSTVGYMSIQKPYLILTRPRMCLPEDQNTFTGYPAYVTMTPGDTSGYTEFEIIHLENIPATDAEKNELETLMKTGVIL